jgi:putative hydrolase of the HAD superfamily
VSRWQAIVFDLDDTLYPERDYVFSGFRAVAGWAESHLGIPAVQGLAELKGLFEQGVRGDTFNRWLAGHDLVQDDLAQQLVRAYREHEPSLIPFPEVPDLLSSLHQRYRLGLVSDGHLAVQQRKLAALSLDEHFDAVVFSDEWGREAWKPSTKPFEIVLERLAADAAKSVYVADNPTKDFLGARQAGMFTVWVRRPSSEYAHLSPPTAQHAPHWVVTSLTELEQAITEQERIL